VAELIPPGTRPLPSATAPGRSLSAMASTPERPAQRTLALPPVNSTLIRMAAQGVVAVPPACGELLLIKLGVLLAVTSGRGARGSSHAGGQGARASSLFFSSLVSNHGFLAVLLSGRTHPLPPAIELSIFLLQSSCRSREPFGCTGHCTSLLGGGGLAVVELAALQQLRRAFRAGGVECAGPAVGAKSVDTEGPLSAKRTVPTSVRFLRDFSNAHSPTRNPVCLAPDFFTVPASDMRSPLVRTDKKKQKQSLLNIR
jgi:hypothetical protein